MPIRPGPTLPSDVTQHTLARGPLENPLVWQGLLVAAGVVAILLFRHGRARPGKFVTVGALLAAAGVCWLNAYVGYVRTPHDLALLMSRGNGWTAQAGQGLAVVTAPDGTVAVVDSGPRLIQLPLPDPGRGVPAGVAHVLLPPGYDNPANARLRYPVAYLIQGYPGSAQDWFTAGAAQDTMRYLLADHVVRPMIVVSPDMTAGRAADWECLNVPGGPQLEDYLMNTVVPGVDTRLRTIADRGNRALGGMSGGAYCALNIGLHHLPSFGSLLITLPYDSLGSSAGVLRGNERLIKRNTPAGYIPTMRFTHPVSVIIVAGGSDHADVATAYRVAGALSKRGQDVAVHVEPGQGHTWREARVALPYMLDFAFGHPRVAPATPDVKIPAAGHDHVPGSRPHRSPKR